MEMFVHVLTLNVQLLQYMNFNKVTCCISSIVGGSSTDLPAAASASCINDPNPALTSGLKSDIPSVMVMILGVTYPRITNELKRYSCLLFDVFVLMFQLQNHSPKTWPSSSCSAPQLPLLNSNNHHIPYRSAPSHSQWSVICITIQNHIESNPRSPPPMRTHHLSTTIVPLQQPQHRAEPWNIWRHIIWLMVISNWVIPTVHANRWVIIEWNPSRALSIGSRKSRSPPPHTMSHSMNPM